MRLSAVLTIIWALVLVTIATPAFGSQPEGKGKPLPHPSEATLILEGYNLDYDPNSQTCNFDGVFSWENARGARTLTYSVVLNGTELWSDEVSVRRKDFVHFFSYSVDPGVGNKKYTVNHRATLADRNGQVVASFDDDPGTPITCNVGVPG